MRNAMAVTLVTLLMVSAGHGWMRPHHKMIPPVQRYCQSLGKLPASQLPYFCHGAG